MNNLKTLYNILNSKKLISKSFKEFVRAYQNSSYQKKVFNVLSSKKIYNKDINSFELEFSNKNIKVDDIVDEKEDPKNVNWFNQTWFGRGFKAASTTGEATDLMMSDFSNIDISEVQAFMDAKKEEAATSSPSERMQRFQKQYIKEGKTWSAFFRGVRKQPGLLPELFVQSLGTQIGTAFDAPEAIGLAAGTAATGAAIGAKFGGIGAIPGAFTGLMGGLATSMESALTFGELIEKELAKQGKDFTDENIKELLESPMGKTIRNRALGRGLAIGTIEGLSGGLAGKAGLATKKVVEAAVDATKITGKAAATTGAAVAGTTVEAIGGGTGEVAGRLAAAQEMDPAEIGFEAITGTVTAPGNVGLALLTHKTPKYHINDPNKKQPISKSTIQDIVNTSTPLELAQMDINVENDPILEREIYEKKKQGIYESQIDEKIKDEADRKALVDLAFKRDNAKADLQKEGIAQVPRAKENLQSIEDQISEIINKYEGATDVAATETAAETRKKLRDISISKTKAFAETAGKQIGKDVKIVADDIIAQDSYTKMAKEFNQMAEEHNKKNPDDQIELLDPNKDVTGADGFIAGDTIFINEDVAGRTGAINVGAHEVLHGIIDKHVENLSVEDRTKLITDFKNTLTKDQRDYIENRIKENYQQEIAEDASFLDNTTEWMTMFSDGIAQGDIKYNETVFDKLKNTFQEILRKFGIKKEFANGRQVYNFMKEYNKNVQQGRLGARALGFAKAAPGPAAGVRMAKSTPLEAINDLIPDNVKTKAQYDNFINDPRKGREILNSIYQPGGVINNYIRSRQLTKAEGDIMIEKVVDRVLKFDPQAKRADGSVVGVEAFGERIFADTRYAKLTARETLAIEAAEKKRTTRLDDPDVTDIADTTPTPTTKATKPGTKPRKLKSLADVTLDNKDLISTNTTSILNQIVEENPTNIEQQIEEIIKPIIVNETKKQMGNISFDKKENKVVVSEEYKAYHATNYEAQVQSLDVDKIKNKYKNLFTLEKTGVEEKKTKKADKPTLKKDSNYRKGIYKISTNKAIWTKYFTDTTSDVKPQSHYNKLRARQTSIATDVTDAIIEKSINDYIIDNSTNLDAIVKAKLKNYAYQLNRQKNEVKGNYNDQLKFSKSKVNDASFIIDEINKYDIETVMPNGRLAEKYKKYKISKIVEDFIYNDIYKAGLLSGPVDTKSLQYISKAYKKLYKAGKRGAAYEMSIIQTSIALEKILGKDVIEVLQKKPIETGGRPDHRVSIHGSIFNIEAKMADAQYSSVTFALDENGNFVIKKDYTFNDQILPLGKKIQPGIKAAKKRLKKEGFEWTNLKLLPNKMYDILKNEPVTIDGVNYSSYLNAMSAEMDINLDVVSEIYNKKKDYPVNLIQLMGRGLFYMGGFNDATNVFNLPLLKGKAKLTLRISSNSQYKTVKGVRSKTGNRTLSWRAIPTLSKATLNTLKSPHSIGNVAGVQNLIESEGAQNLKMSKSATNGQTFTGAVRASRSTKKPTRGISIWDFDDTLARTKSGVRYTMPNPDGTPKPRRKVIFLAGGPGSGKSTVVKNLGLEKQGFKVVNQDISLQWLMKNHGLPTDMRDFTPEQMSKFGSLGWEARDIAQRKKAKFKGRGDGIIVDGTGASFRSMEAQRMQFLRNGYDVHMVFVETSLETALERNKARKERSLKDSIVERTWNSVMKNKSRFQQSQIFGDNFTLINTDKLTQNDPIPVKEANKINDFTSGYIKERLTAEEFAEQGADILAQGGTFDFSEFDVVTEGSTGPLFAKAMNRAKKYGTKDQFILTARPVASAPHIQQFLESQGLNIPIENVAALENSTPEAKALWIAEKISEGYNDIYFADDALQNVQAVQNMVDQFDVKSDIQQAKVKFSKNMNDNFNSILEEISGIDADKRFSDVKARKRGADKGKFRFFIPPSHEDFVGLLYNFMGKGKRGNEHRDFFEKALIRPLNTANREFDTARQSIANDFKTLNKSMPDVKKKLTKKTPDGDFTFEDAIRTYLWDKHGHDIPGLTKTDQQKLVDIVNADTNLRAYAENLNVISKRKDYVSPSKEWEAGNIRTDLTDATGRVGRAEYFTEFLENANEIFSKENLNKIEAIYGKAVKEALQDVLYRIETGRNRPAGQNALVNKFTNFINGAVGSVMFFNIRSAVLQQMSMVNYLNFGDNNIFAAAKAFANQKQYWADWAFIFNSDMLKQRRGGIQTDVNGAELAKTVQDSRNPISAVVKKLLEYGFKPTQIGDNIAIATGGATYYRNKINTYLRQGLSQKEAQSKAFDDFQNITQSTQQSARPDMVSQQQASPLGKFILAFQNVTSQFNRLGKKAFLDLYNRRISPEYKNAKNPQLQSDMSNTSRIVYYLAVQNLIFYSLQTALFAMMFDDDKDDEQFLKKRERMINGSIDSVLRGSGVMGGVIATLKNMAIKWHEQRDKTYNADESAVMMEMLNVSPPIGIKARQIVNAEKTLNYNKKVIEEMDTFDLDNPVWSAVTSYTEAVTNIPVNRLYKKTLNVRESLNNQHTAWQRVLMFMGWSPWNLGVKNKQVEGIKEDVKKRKSKKKKSKPKYVHP